MVRKCLNDDAKEGTFALVLHNGGQTLYQREASLVSNELQWNQKDEFGHDEAPPLDLEQARLEPQTNGDDSLQAVVLYADTLTAVPTERDDETDETDETDIRGYVVEFDNGHRIPAQGGDVHTTQATNMTEAVRYLIEEHDLLQNVSLPHTPSWAHKNATLNDEPEHSDGREMQNYEKMPGDVYLFTHLSAGDKMGRISDLAGRVGLDVTFRGQWDG